MSTFEEQFPSLCIMWRDGTKYIHLYDMDGVTVQPNLIDVDCHFVAIGGVIEHCLDKQKVREAILRNFIDDEFRKQLFKELGL